MRGIDMTSGPPGAAMRLVEFGDQPREVRPGTMTDRSVIIGYDRLPGLSSLLYMKISISG
jgi:hypothetical protein